MFKKRKRYANGNCPKCGSLLEPNANFCVDCGAPVKRKKPAANITKDGCCPNCNANITPGSVFCTNCGTSLKTMNPSKKNCCTKCGNALVTNASFCMKCGASVNFNPLRKNIQSQGFDPELTGLLNEDAGSMSYGDSAPTSLLDQGYNRIDGSEATSLLDESPIFPRLVRISTGEEIILNKQVFRIGKERTHVDYCVTGNKTVSRVHAEIVNKNGVYFIYDNNSTNKTYLNGTAIPVQVEIKLNDGDMIRMSDEEFTFHL